MLRSLVRFLIQTTSVKIPYLMYQVEPQLVFWVHQTSSFFQGILVRINLVAQSVSQRALQRYRKGQARPTSLNFFRLSVSLLGINCDCLLCIEFFAGYHSAWFAGLESCTELRWGGRFSTTRTCTLINSPSQEFVAEVDYSLDWSCKKKFWRL